MSDQPPARSGPLQIPNASGWYQETLAFYDYERDPLHCPICGGVGIAWHGWFHCDGTCQAVALVESGRTFLPVPTPTPRKGDV
jgi:hypothetical protein